jgi:hypothetical protein
MIAKRLTQILQKTLLIGTLAFSPLGYGGCEKNSNNDEYEQQTNSVSQTSNNDREEREKSRDEGNPTQTQPSQPVSANFAITYPASGTVVPYQTTIEGVGIKKPVTRYRCTVGTDRPYDQVGSLNVNDDGSWTYYPVYFGGLGEYASKHSLELMVVYNDGTWESCQNNGIIGPGTY